MLVMLLYNLGQTIMYLVEYTMINSLSFFETFHQFFLIYIIFFLIYIEYYYKYFTQTSLILYFMNFPFFTLKKFIKLKLKIKIK